MDVVVVVVRAVVIVRVAMVVVVVVRMVVVMVPSTGLISISRPFSSTVASRTRTPTVSPSSGRRCPR